MASRDKNAQSLVKYENELQLINSAKMQSENGKEIIEDKKILFPETPAQIEMEILVDENPYLFTISEKGNAMPYKKEFELDLSYLKWASIFMIHNNERTKIKDIHFNCISKDKTKIIFIWDQRNLRYAIKEKNESCYSKCDIILNNVSLLPNPQKHPLLNCTPYEIRTKKRFKDQFNAYREFYIDVFQQGIQFPCTEEMEFFNNDVKISKYQNIKKLFKIHKISIILSRYQS